MPPEHSAIAEPPPLAHHVPSSSRGESRLVFLLYLVGLAALCGGGAVVLLCDCEQKGVIAAISVLCFICAMGAGGIINELRARR
jgi:hypothetical protein